MKIKYEVRNGMYICTEQATYTSERFSKSITIHGGFKSDGATCAKDIKSSAWWFHDALSEWKCWDDNSPCSIYESSLVIHDILKSEGRWFRCRSWFIGTLIGRFILKAIRVD